MPRSVLIGAVALAALAAAAPAFAQDRPDRPQLRRLDWAGRPAADTAVGAGPRAVIPHAGAQPTRVALRPAQPWRPTQASAEGRRGLTPASAFSTAPSPSTSPVWTPPSAPVEPAPRPQPRVESPPAPAPQPTRRPEPQPQPVPLEPAPQPQARLVQPSPVAPQPDVPQPAPDAPLDPMAPRRDAPIFRIQGARSAPAPVPAPSSGTATEPTPAQPEAASPPQWAPQASTGAPPRQQGARYYSVHRQNGRTPDPAVLPEPVWLDRMPVQLESTPQSEDLASPPETPQMVRGSDGRMRPVQGAQNDPIP